MRKSRLSGVCYFPRSTGMGVGIENKLSTLGGESYEKYSLQKT